MSKILFSIITVVTLSQLGEMPAEASMTGSLHKAKQTMQQELMMRAEPPIYLADSDQPAPVNTAAPTNEIQMESSSDWGPTRRTQ